MDTYNLAKKLGLVEIISTKKDADGKIEQPFSYIFVLDFEATCWDKHDVNKRPFEIIEFSVVLYSISQNKVVQSFQQYVMPTESPKLSEFCKNFTNITQEQVDNGVPLGTCLMLFKKWLNEQACCYKLSVFGTNEPNLHRAVFATWSDWDLKTCLANECKRKRIKKPEIFNAWVDVRLLYMEHYGRRPKGLNGALTEIGLRFIGNEHCGLDDAHNTAILVGRMIQDGVLVRVTKDLSL
ncbi:hypothetical protein PPYR_04395 [Photinus pyralis]|uniref:Exonuclease domain-containing protein n=1 Tax=Photinus pyralis TaxID=7054 RepID=A0A1Y1JYT9_PHOPY|nr:ERI1 exoribonuclease 2 [Photinus pyralis]KAB0802209.1 hypothetical protein PPYR_04395 [Photinus pyralis]